MSGPTVAELPAPPPGRTRWPWTEGAAAMEGAQWPRISVVTPSYQQGRYLEETIRSVLLQGYPNLEYIVVDGGSQDESRAILERYSPFLSWWRSAPDRGQGHALNVGFARATGEIRGYLNSDDLYEPGALRAVAEWFDSSRPWIAGQVRYLHDTAGSWPVPQRRGRRLSDWFLTCPVSQPGSFWAAELQERAGPFREDLAFALDYEMWLRFRVRFGVKPSVIRNQLAVYRLHDDSKTVAGRAEFSKETRRVRAFYEARLPRWRRWGIGLVRRHCRARYRGRRAAAHALGGEWSAAVGAALSALRDWPFVLADPTAYLALFRMARRDAAQTHPEVWPDWDSVWGDAAGGDPGPLREGAIS